MRQRVFLFLRPTHTHIMYMQCILQQHIYIHCPLDWPGHCLLRTNPLKWTECELTASQPWLASATFLMSSRRASPAAQSSRHCCRVADVMHTALGTGDCHLPDGNSNRVGPETSAGEVEKEHIEWNVF